MPRHDVNEVFVFDAVRTPRGKGKAGGALAAVPPVELVKQLTDAMARRGGSGAREIDHLMLGCVGQVGAQGGHIALVSKLYAGLPMAASAWTLNNYCTSGLSAIAGAVDKVAGGNAELVMAGGVESMSHVPFLHDQATYYADPAFSLRMNYLPVALSADLLAVQENVTRRELDEVSATSHRRADIAHAAKQGQQSLIPVADAAGQIILTQDEYVRAETTADGLAAFPAAFAPLGASYAEVLKHAHGADRMDHRHAVVHAPGIADGAGLALIGSREGGERRGLKPKARIVGYAELGGDPVMGLNAGVDAMEQVLARSGRRLSDIDLVEYMGAFAVVPALFRRRHPEAVDKTNVFGGHIAKGHALGATGAILMSSLIDAMAAKNAASGLIVAFAASGIGAAMIVERTA